MVVHLERCALLHADAQFDGRTRLPPESLAGPVAKQAHYTAPDSLRIAKRNTAIR